jgi:phosphoribosylformimino-5-aminoimidazole carboxamide ribotide isomerase
LHVIPAIDLMKGRVVRLSRGDPSTAKVYDQLGSPVEIASKWKREGAQKLHIIDLDAAFGFGNNTSSIAEIAGCLSLPIQVGGGIREIDSAERMFKLGISQVILGALAFSKPQTIKQIQEKFGQNTVIVALDNKDGRIMVEGWKKPTKLGVEEAIAKFADLGVGTFLVTSITKDGMLSGPDVELLSDLCRDLSVGVIAAGGIGSLEDLKMLNTVGVAGVVVGKALYEGRFTLGEALTTVRGE